MQLKPSPASSRLRRHLRAALLVVLILVGLSVARFERVNQDQTYRLWGFVYEIYGRHLIPLRRLTDATGGQLRRLPRLWEAERQNRELRAELGRTRLEQALTQEQLGRLERLSGLGQWSGPPELRFMAADVIGVVASGDTMVLVINRGADDGIAPRDPVVALGGLVGIVQTTARDSAQVQAVVDANSAVGAVSTGTRSRGVVRGRGAGRALEFMPENETVPIPIGQQLITSGFDNSVYPKGITIGRIVERGLNDYGIPYGVVESAAPLDTVEEVLLVLPRSRGDDAAATTATLGRYSIRVPRAGDPATTDTLGTATLPSSDFATSRPLGDAAPTSATTANDRATTLSATDPPAVD